MDSGDEIRNGISGVGHLPGNVANGLAHVPSAMLPVESNVTGVDAIMQVFSNAPTDLMLSFFFFIILVALVAYTCCEQYVVHHYRNGFSFEDEEMALEKEERRFRLLAAALPRSDAPEFIPGNTKERLTILSRKIRDGSKPMPEVPDPIKPPGPSGGGGKAADAPSPPKTRAAGSPPQSHTATPAILPPGPSGMDQPNGPQPSLPEGTAAVSTTTAKAGAKGSDGHY